MNPRSESTIATMIIGGVGSFVGGFLVFMLGIGSAPGTGQGGVAIAVLGLLMILGGIALAGFAVFSGLIISKGQNKGKRTGDPRTKVLAKFALNGQGERVLNDWEYDEPTTKYYVRLTTSDGRTAEYQCGPEVYAQCGEGLVGEAVFQGKWLGGFRPYIGGPPAPVSTDPLSGWQDRPL